MKMQKNIFFGGGEGDPVRGGSGWGGGSGWMGTEN